MNNAMQCRRESEPNLPGELVSDPISLNPISLLVSDPISLSPHFPSPTCHGNWCLMSDPIFLYLFLA